MFTTTMLSLAALGATPAAAVLPAASAATEFEWKAPAAYVKGAPFNVTVIAEVGADGGSIDTWQLSPAAFSVDGKALAEKAKGSLPVGPGGRLELTFDLAANLTAVAGPFKLAYTPAGGEARSLPAFEVVPKEVDFLQMPTDELAGYNAVFQTNRGDMLMEFWPDVAPKHVANFLELVNTGFYDQVLFHRVIPGFMIQGGDPNTKNPDLAPRWGTGNGPRTLEAEFNSKKHERGVLSAARSADPNSASCQFFVCHARAPHLDNQYTGFGRLVEGFDALDAIASTPTSAGDRPVEPQRIEKAYALRPLK